MSVEPIKPGDVVAAKKKSLPDVVIETFNELIAKHWSGSSSKFEMHEAKEILMGRLDCSGQYLFDNGYMDIEDIYRAEGWEVCYDRPGYNESYQATYEFSRK